MQAGQAEFWVSLLSEPAIDRAQGGQDCRVFYGAVRLERNESGEEDELTFLGGFNGSSDVAAGEQIDDRDAFQAERGTWTSELSGGECGAGGRAGPAGGRIHFTRHALKGGPASSQLDATLDFLVGPFELQAGHHEEARTGTAPGRPRFRDRRGWLHSARLRDGTRGIRRWKRLERLEISGQKKLPRASSHDQLSEIRLVACRAAKMAASSGERFSVAMPVSVRE